MITQDKKEKINQNKLLIGFLTWMLAKEPVHRPTLFDVIGRFKYVKTQILEEL